MANYDKLRIAQVLTQEGMHAERAEFFADRLVTSGALESRDAECVTDVFADYLPMLLSQKLAHEVLEVVPEGSG